MAGGAARGGAGPRGHGLRRAGGTGRLGSVVGGHRPADLVRDQAGGDRPTGGAARSDRPRGHDHRPRGHPGQGRQAGPAGAAVGTAAQRQAGAGPAGDQPAVARHHPCPCGLLLPPGKAAGGNGQADRHLLRVVRHPGRLPGHRCALRAARPGGPARAVDTQGVGQVHRQGQGRVAAQLLRCPDGRRDAGGSDGHHRFLVCPPRHHLQDHHQGLGARGGSR